VWSRSTLTGPKLEIARGEATAQKLSNIEFRLADATNDEPEAELDLVHARFLLTHLSDPGAAVTRMHGAPRPGGMTGEVKLLAPITMENIAEAVVGEGLASQAEIDRIVAELHEYARDPGTVGCTPRIVEAWGYQTAA